MAKNIFTSFIINMKLLPIGSVHHKNTQISHKAVAHINKNISKPLLESSLTALGAIGTASILKIPKEAPPILRTDFPDGSHKEETIFSDNSIISTKYDSNNKKESSTIITPAEIEGEFSIKELTGEKTFLASSVKKTTGNEFFIEKNFTSPAGIKTQVQKKGNENQYTFSYEIANADNQSLLNFNRTYKKLDNNHTLTTINDKKFLNEFGVLGVESKKVDENDNPAKSSFMIINWRFEDLLKKFPADLFRTMDKNKVRLFIDSSADYKIAITTANNEIVFSPLFKDDSFVLAHELGHIKNTELKDLDKDEELIKIFEEEKDSANKIMGEVIKNEAEYLIFEKSGLNETIAEVYAILSGLDHNGTKNPHAFRSNVLMKYFPQTIACIAKKIFTDF